MCQVRHAGDVLGSEERRELYDEFGFDDLKVGGGSGHVPPGMSESVCHVAG